LEEVAEENFMRPFVLGTRDQEVWLIIDTIMTYNANLV
jgi:hypothetical protein